MTTKELIRDEIRKWQSNIEAKCPESTSSRNYTKEEWNAIYEYNAYTRILSFLDTLPDESAQPTRGYDEAYLNEKIAKASKSWEGVDVDKFMDEVRGRDPVTDCHDLTEAAKKYAEEQAFWWIRGNPYTSQEYAFKAGAEWQKAKMLNDNPVIMSVEDFQALIDSHAKRVEADYKEKMMEGALEGVVWGQAGKNINISVLKGVCKYLEQDDLPYNVRIIILPKED